MALALNQTLWLLTERKLSRQSASNSLWQSIAHLTKRCCRTKFPLHSNFAAKRGVIAYEENMLKILKNIFSNNDLEDDVEAEDNQLWIMIKESEFFRDESHLKIIDELAEIIEGNGLGELDGHSSGAHQLEINFYEVDNYESCKSAVANFFKKHPKIEYTVSQEYETTYERL